MLIEQFPFNEMADQTFAWSATYNEHFNAYNEHFNISIRAFLGERTKLKQKLVIKAIDKSLNLAFCNVIEMIIVRNSMKCDEIIHKINLHIVSHSSRTSNWFAGARVKPRLHPWDEGELLFSTYHWIDLQADSPLEARVAVQRLVETGLAQFHNDKALPYADHVFAYALN